MDSGTSVPMSTGADLEEEGAVDPKHMAVNKQFIGGTAWSLTCLFPSRRWMLDIPP